MTLRIGRFATLLQVFDRPTSLAFYRDVLGFEVVSDVPPDDHCELMLNTAYEAHERTAAPEPARIAAHQDVTLYFDCEDVDAAYAYLRERGVAAKPPRIAPYGMKQVYLRDPDGYEICLQHPA